MAAAIGPGLANPIPDPIGQSLNALEDRIEDRIALEENFINDIKRGISGILDNVAQCVDNAHGAGAIPPDVAAEINGELNRLSNRLHNDGPLQDGHNQTAAFNASFGNVAQNLRQQNAPAAGNFNMAGGWTPHRRPHSKRRTHPKRRTHSKRKTH
jgi:hypothetical protein